MRSSGVLLHITSLPSKHGVGTMGGSAYRFVDFLEKAGQKYWQVLPLNPTGYGDSPYQSYSSFAGNPYLIDPELLRAEKLLTRAEIAAADIGGDPARADFEALSRTRFPLLRKAYARFTAHLPSEFFDFCRKNADWLSDYALFMAIKDASGGKPFFAWEDGLKFRKKAAIERAERTLGVEIGFYKFLQYEFTKQWTALREYAHAHGVKIIGDLPIYVSGDSADVWANPRSFQLDRDLRPLKVAGCPPDAFSEDGQLWGNPLYDWDYLRAHGYDFWCRRAARQAELYDTFRIDHFRGFEAYYAIPSGETTARGGKWEKGPGMSLFRAIEKKVGRLDVIAEDLGYITPEVAKLLHDTGYPGMKVLQFAFDPHTPSAYLPHTYTDTNAVAYVGTHDNDTAEGWMQSGDPEATAYARRYLHLTREEGYAWGLIRGAMTSSAALSVCTAQDLLSLGSEARMNTPSTPTGNWTWRLTKLPSDRIAAKLYQLTKDTWRL